VSRVAASSKPGAIPEKRTRFAHASRSWPTRAVDPTSRERMTPGRLRIPVAATSRPPKPATIATVTGPGASSGAITSGRRNTPVTKRPPRAAPNDSAT